MLSLVQFSAQESFSTEKQTDPKVFGFVEMEEDEAAEAAISALNNQELDSRNLRVNEAIERERRPRDNRY